MPIGNDVVDLGHPRCQPDTIHPRFDSRAFSAQEIEFLAASDVAHRTRWSLWAAKESAFKAARKLDPLIRFIPRDFEVFPVGRNADGHARPWAEVVHRRGRFDIWLDHADHWVHAAASHGGGEPGFRVDGDPSANPGPEDDGCSRRVRKLAGDALGAVLDIPAGEIRIVSTDRIPQARRGPAPLPIDLSLSHDGRFIACAWRSTRSPGPTLR